MTHNGQLFGRLDDPSVRFVLQFKRDMSVLIPSSYNKIQSHKTHRERIRPRPEFPSHQNLQFITIKISLFDDLPFPSLGRGRNWESTP